MASENTLSESQFKKSSCEKLFNFERLEKTVSSKLLHPQESDTRLTLSEPEHEAIPKEMITGETTEKFKEQEPALSVQEKNMKKQFPKDTQSPPENTKVLTPNIFSKLPNRKSKCQNSQFLSTTDESIDSSGLYLKSSPHIQSNPFVGNFRTSSPNNPSISSYPLKPITPVHINPFITNIPNTNHALTYQDLSRYGDQNVHCYNPPNLPHYQGPDFTILPSSDHQHIFLQQGAFSSRACSPFSHVNAPYAPRTQPTNTPSTINEVTCMPNPSVASFPGTQPSLPNTIPFVSSTQSAASLGTKVIPNLPQNSNLLSQPNYLPNSPLPSNGAVLLTPNKTVPGGGECVTSNTNDAATPCTTYVPGNASVVLPPAMSTPCSAEQLPVSSDVPANTHLGNVSAAQSVNLPVYNVSSPNTPTFLPAQGNLNLSQSSQGPHSQHPLNEGNKPRQEQSDATENTLEVPRTQSTSVPSSPVLIRKETTQQKTTRKSSIFSRQQSKSSGDEGPGLSPLAAHKHANAIPPTASPGAARRKVSRKMSNTSSIGSHHNVDNSINESSAGSGGPNATSSPNTKHKASVVYHR
jgi:hypothetical protein